MKNKRLKSKVFEIDTIIYPFTIYVGFIDIVKYVKYLEKQEIKDDTISKIHNLILEYKNQSFGMYFYIDNVIGMFIFKQPNNQNDIFDVVTHESYHITELILKVIGLKHSKKSEEAYCYLNGFINKEIFKQI